MKQMKMIKIKGFLLAEAVFSIFVTILVISILQGLLKSIQTCNEQAHQADEIAYSYVQLRRFLNDGNSKIVYTEPNDSQNKVVLIKVLKNGSKETNKRYVLQKYGSMIRSTTPEGGHMPLILNVKRAIFNTADGNFRITVVEKDNRKSDLVFKVDKRPIKKNKNDRKNKQNETKRQCTSK